MIPSPMPPTPASNFGLLDWIVLAAYLLLLVGTGVWLSRRQKGTEDYFLAGRSMPAWAVAISVLATSLSAATFLGVPQYSYAGNLTYISAMVGTVIAAFIAAAFFIPAYYRHGVSTVYELLEVRFGPGARLAASAMFMIGRVMASGARVYIAAHALAFILWGDIAPAHLLFAVAILSLAGVLYTITGGIATVIWTDVIQTIVFLAAVIAALVLLVMRIPASLSDVAVAMTEAGKSQVFDLSFDFTSEFTLWTALIGLSLLNLAALATDQDLAQRVLTCRSPLKAAQSVIASQLVAIPVVMLFMVIGALLWVMHNRPDLMGGLTLPEPDGTRKVFLSFIVGGLPAGLSGLMIAGLFAAGLSSLDSSLNAMSSAFVSDFYKRARPNRPDTHYLAIGRTGVAVWGVILGLFAAFCVYWQQHTPDSSLLAFALSVMVFAYTGLLAVFICAVFTKRGNTRSVIAALITGFAITLLFDPLIWTRLPLPDQVTTFKLAFPWVMTLATSCAFAVALCGRPRAQNLAR